MTDCIETIDYRGYKIKIYPDECPLNPWKEWDCEPPIVIKYDREIKSYGLDPLYPTLTREEIIENLSDIAAFLGYRSRWEMGRDLWSLGPLGDSINDALQDEAYNNIDGIAFLWSLKRDHYVHEAISRGYCQGDYAELLVVITPEWRKKVGARPKDDEKNAKAAADLWSAWAWGDVYGFIVEDENGQTVDSCWGFYGDPEESGLIETAKCEIDAIIEHSKAKAA